MNLIADGANSFTLRGFLETRPLGSDINGVTTQHSRIVKLSIEGHSALPLTAISLCPHRERVRFVPGKRPAERSCVSEPAIEKGVYANHSGSDWLTPRIVHSADV